jgi:hypothetical protein
MVAAIVEANGVLSGLTFTLIGWAVLVAVLVGQLRTYVELDEWRLVIQNPVSRHEIPLLEIAEVVTGQGTLWLITSEGIAVKASAIVATRVSASQNKRVEAVADAIRTAIERASTTFR